VNASIATIGTVTSATIAWDFPQAMATSNHGFRRPRVSG
jgi:hypothetical protein